VAQAQIPLQAKIRVCQRLGRAYTLAQYMVSGTYTTEILSRLHEIMFGRKTISELSLPDTMIIISDALATYIMSVIQDAIVVFCSDLVQQPEPAQKQEEAEKSEGSSS